MTDQIKSQVDDFFDANPPKPEEGKWESEDDFDNDLLLRKPDDEGTTTESGAQVETPLGEVTPPEVPPSGDTPVVPLKEGEPVVAATVATIPEVVPPATTPSEIDQLKAQNATLLQKIEELLTAPKPVVPPVVAPTVVPPPVSAPTPGMVSDFIGDEDVDEILSSKEKLNSLLGKVADQAVQRFEQQIMSTLPHTVQGHVQTQITLKSVVDTFYAENKDLFPVKKIVAAVANGVAADNPDWDLGKVLDETANKVRETYGLPKPATVVADKKTEAVKPALPGVVKSGQRGGTALTPLQKQIIDIL